MPIGEHETEASQLRLARQALAQLRESVIITDTDIELPGPLIIWVNAAFTRMTGYSQTEVIGLTPRILQGPKTRRSTIDRLRRQLKAGEAFTGDDINYRKDGSEFNIDWYIEPLRDEEGKITHFIAVQRDTTLERQLQAQLLQAQRLESIGMLASGVAHDLNNILAPVLMGAAILSERLTAKEDQAMLALMQNGAERGAALVKQILSFARGVAGNSTLAQARHLIGDVVSLAQQTFPKRIAVESSVAADLLPILGDATQIHQVLMNLCVNARDAIEEDGTITISAENLLLAEPLPLARDTVPPGEYVRIRVSDTGSGIPASAVSKIFLPFFTTKTPEKGTGLGLSTVLSIVRSHGGFLDLESEPGRGTTFSVFFPAVSELVAETVVPISDQLLGRGQTILIVDDEQSILGIAREALAASGYRVVTASNGVQAARVFREKRPAVTLLDLMMADSGGPWALQQIRALDPEARIVVMSGLSADEADDLAPGANAFLAKPFTVLGLLAAVSAELLEGPAR